MTVLQAKKLAADYLQAYFHSKKLHSGEPISKEMINHPYTISRVLNTKSSDGFEMAHKMLGEPTKEERRKVEKTSGVYGNTEVIIQILEECSKMGIPKCFAAGILLLHLELCAGLSVN